MAAGAATAGAWVLVLGLWGECSLQEAAALSPQNSLRTWAPCLPQAPSPPFPDLALSQGQQSW